MFSNSVNRQFTSLLSDTFDIQFSALFNWWFYGHFNQYLVVNSAHESIGCLLHSLMIASIDNSIHDLLDYSVQSSLIAIAVNSVHGSIDSLVHSSVIVWIDYWEIQTLIWA